MTFRKFNTETWSDPWFERLSRDAKLGFIYLWTNSSCNPAGFYELSSRRIEFELGYHIDTIYSEINTKVEWFPHENCVWVKNFFRHQAQSSKFAIAALNCLKENPERLQMFVEYNLDILKTMKIDLSRYHIDTISISYPTEQSREEAEQLVSRNE